MPVLIIHGIHPQQKNQEQLEELISDLQETTASMEELGLAKKQVSVFLPADLCLGAGLGEEIICFCEGLFNKSERTKDVRNKLANKILAVLMKHFPDTLVEVFVKKFHGDDGFASSQQEL